MIENKYVLLLNAEVKSHLLTRTPQEKRRIREKFEFLENGLWDAGVRVKKLKGVSDRVVLEARLSRDERILFSLGRHGASTAIYLWGIVRHDDVASAARRVLPENVPFLDFEPESREDLPELIVDDLPARHFSMEAVDKEVPADYGPQKWLVLNDEQWRRILLASDPATFDIYLFLTADQERVLRHEPPILLAGTAGSGKTTLAVYYLLRREFLARRRIFLTCSPFLKRFSEGIYDGLVSHAAEPADETERAVRPDFYVFRDLLREIVHARERSFDPAGEVGIREFAGIFRNHKLSRKYDTELVWEEIRSIIKGAKSPVSPNRLRKLAALHASGELTRGLQNELKEYLLGLRNFELIDKVERAVASRGHYASYDRFLEDLDRGAPASRAPVARVLEEVLKIVEKRAARLSDPLLTFGEYMTLGRKRAPNFLYDRREIYTVAEYYQNRLETEGRWDEIDLCKSALERLHAPDDRFVYDLVVCDEVQDFADIQLSLIFRLAGNRRNLFLAGDPKQIINPSGFRWEEVKNRFFDRGLPVPEVRRLTLNFRCVGNIVRLANALIDLKQEMVGLADTEMKEAWKFNGKPPFLLYEMTEEEVLAGIRLTGAGQVVLVRGPAERERLKQALGTERVFTLNEAKGLEFDTVFLWKVAGEKRSDDLWRKAAAGAAPERVRESHIKHELNLLYVAVTRARNTLVIYDGRAAARVWDLPLLRDKLYRTSERGSLVEVWQRVSTPPEWERQGDYFLEREYYPAALECFKNAGNPEKAGLAEAFVLEARGRWGEAAGLFEARGRKERAAENYEKGRDFGRAMALWEEMKNTGRARLCRVRMYETEGRYEEAAAAWEKLKEFEHALANWEKAGNHAKIARYHLSRKRYEKAAASFERAQEFLLAAQCCKKAKRPREAADLYLRAGDLKSAADLYRKLKDRQSLLACYLRMGDFYEAGKLHEQARDTDKAIESYRKFAGLAEANRDRLLREADRGAARSMTLRAALRYSALARYDLSAPFYQRKGMYDRAIEEYRALGDAAGAASCHAAAGRFYEAAVEMEKVDTADRVEKVTGWLDDYLRGTKPGARRTFFRFMDPPDRNRMEKLRQEADLFARNGAWEQALVRYRAVWSDAGVLESYLHLDRDEEALGCFLKKGSLDLAGRYLDEKPCRDLSLPFLEWMAERARTELWRHDKRGATFLELAVRLVRERWNAGRDEPMDGPVDLLMRPLASYGQNRSMIPASLLHLALEARRYSPLFRVASFYKPGRIRMEKDVRDFFAAVKREADRCGDRNLLALWCYLYDPPAYEHTLEGLEPTDWNFELFSGSRAQYAKAVTWLLSRNRVEDAADVCRTQGKFVESGRIYEEAGRYMEAGIEYLAADRYEDAMRCARKGGDSKRVARIYEKMGQYENAMRIWQSLGQTRQVARLRKKLAKSRLTGSLDELF